MAIFKEDARQAYNNARKKFMRKYHLKAEQVPPALSKADVRNLTPEEVKGLKAGVFTAKQAKLVSFNEEPDDKVSKATISFENKLLDIANRQRADLRKERVTDMTVSKQGHDMPKISRAQVSGPRQRSYEPLQMVPQTAARRVKRGVELLLADISDPTKDQRLKDNLIRAVMRSNIDKDKALVISSKLDSMSARDVGDLYYKETDFDFSYIYDPARDKKVGEDRATFLYKVLGIDDNYNPKVSKKKLDLFNQYESEGDLIETARQAKKAKYLSMRF